jgi:hypothetical protein
MNRTLLIIAMLCSSTSAFAQPPVINNAEIDNSGAQYQGNFSVNQAAGDLQQQANARAIAIGHGASATVQIRQRLRGQVDPAMDAHRASRVTPSVTARRTGREPERAPIPSKPTHCVSASVLSRKASTTASSCNRT